jgi:hypothetical protein
MSLLPYQPFPVNILAYPLADFANDGAKAIGCDPAAVALPLLTAVGASIGTTRRIMFKAEWAEYPILWTALVAPSGQKKTPPFDRALRPLHEIQEIEHRRWVSAHEQYEADRIEYERELSNYRKGKSANVPKPPEQPQLVHLLTQDATVEALASMLAETPRGLLMARDELAGWFGGFNQYKGQKGADVPAWLEMHRGGPLKVDRKGKPPLYVPCAAIWVTGTIQPMTLKRCLVPEFFENGMSARLLLGYPPPRQTRWSNAGIDPGTTQRVSDLVRTLRGLNFRVDGHAQKRPIDIPLTADAMAKWIEFVNEHGAETHAFGDQPLAAVWSKLEASAGRFGLIDHLVRWAANPLAGECGPVDVESIEVGISLARWFGHEAQRVYGVFGESEDERRQRELVDLIQRVGGVISIRDLRQKRRRYRYSAQAAQDDLQRLVDARLGRWDYLNTGGRPAHVFVLTEAGDVPVNESPENLRANRGFVDADASDGSNGEAA